jgi:hypothetical protein
MPGMKVRRDVGIERSEDKAETDTYEAYVAPTLRAQVFP